MIASCSAEPFLRFTTVVWSFCNYFSFWTFCFKIRFIICKNQLFGWFSFLDKVNLIMQNRSPMNGVATISNLLWPSTKAAQNAKWGFETMSNDSFNLSMLYFPIYTILSDFGIIIEGHLLLHLETTIQIFLSEKWMMKSQFLSVLAIRNHHYQ